MRRTALVTGAARGIGLAISRQLLDDGWLVARIDRTWDQRARDAIDGPVFEADVSDASAIAAVVAQVEAEAGPVACLVNNAGITRDGFLHKMAPDNFLAVIAVNLVGAFNLCRYTLPGMRARRFGRIVNISSLHALTGHPGQSNYAAAKAGLIGMTKSIALESASHGITANCIAPGLIETEMTADAMAADGQAMIARIPIGRSGTPQDIATLASFLASDRASFITGQVLSVNGGQLMA